MLPHGICSVAGLPCLKHKLVPMPLSELNARPIYQHWGQQHASEKILYWTWLLMSQIQRRWACWVEGQQQQPSHAPGPLDCWWEGRLSVPPRVSLRMSPLHRLPSRKKSRLCSSHLLRMAFANAPRQSRHTRQFNFAGTPMCRCKGRAHFSQAANARG